MIGGDALATLPFFCAKAEGCRLKAEGCPRLRQVAKANIKQAVLPYPSTATPQLVAATKYCIPALVALKRF